MKQIIQNMKTGETKLEDIPSPKASPGHVLIKTTKSLVSLGTERMLVEFGKASLISKARQQPDKVKMVIDKVKADGLMPTLETVFKKLEQPLPLGYCNVGRVVGVGKGITSFKVGDRVVSNGRHAEYVSIPQNLVAHIPDEVTDEEASFTVIASIGLQGIRLINPTFGETIVVTGLGLIGLITAQLLQANGCKVIGIDLDEDKIRIAKARGITTVNPKDGIDIVQFVMNQTNNIGADGVVITASSKSNDIISQAAQMSRKRGRIVLVGVIGLNISRADFYEKELSFQVSCSYGPGRYDETYEQKGQDYPLPYVRWTEKRNFQAILQALAKKSIDVNPMISEVVKLEDYDKIYGNIGASRSIASIIDYPTETELSPVVNVSSNDFEKNSGVFGIIGAGNFTKMSLLPAMKDASIKYIASKGGVNGTALAKKYNISNSTTDHNQILNDSDVNTVIITTRHNLHASMVIDCLKAGKNVFVEKPLAISKNELDEIIDTYINNRKILTVGFNRRFSPHIQNIKKYIDSDAPKNFIGTMNAGAIPADVWVHDMEVGGGRIIGEACHYIDMMTYLSGSKVKEVCMNSMGTHPEENTDNASILLKYENGDNGVINYFANGHKSYSKERLEVYSQGKTFVMDNFRKTTAYGVNGFSSMKTKMDKGHKNQFSLLVERAKNGGESLISFDDIINTTKASFAAIDSLKNNAWVKIS